MTTRRRYHPGLVTGMAMTLRLTDDETRALRAQADIETAALLHSLAGNHGLIDGNKRLVWAVEAVFLRINGHDLDAPEDGTLELVIAVAGGSLADMEKIAERVAGWSRPR